MGTIYTNGDYLEKTLTWHVEDSPWKAGQITKIIRGNGIQAESICEIGCGAGQILEELAKSPCFEDVTFSGYDISPQAIALAKRHESQSVNFYCEDLLRRRNTDYFDILLVIDVFEHIPDYMGFLYKCNAIARYKIYHIPLDIHVSSVLRNAFVRNRYTIGHLHYFTAESAFCTLRDTGHEIVDYCYTDAAFGLFKEHPSYKKAIANIPRWLFSKFSRSFTARVFGGYSLLVLAK